MYFDYPIQTHHLLYNLLDSHDTARFLTVCQGNVAIYQLGVVLQMMLPGMPVIYYGDEIGMTGETDPLCRAGMAWDQVNLDIQSFYQSMISYRQKYDAIRLGDYHIIDISKHCFVFTRTYLKQTILVVVNPTDQNRIITLNETVVKQIHINQPLTIHVDAYGYVIKEIV